MARIDSFRAQLAGGGARPDHFRVSLNFPVGIQIPAAGNAKNKVEFMVKSASLPASRLTTIEIPFRGRTTKVAGDRVFDNWDVTVINDTDFAIRNAMEQWMNGIRNHVRTNGAVASGQYQVDLEVVQLDQNDVPLKQYKFRNCFPVQLSDIGLDFADNNRVEEFRIDFSIDYWTSDTTDQPN